MQAASDTQMPMTPIAIIGMASLMPQSADLHEYWDNIVQGRDCITDVPPSRWDIADYYDPDPTVPDKTYCKYGGFIPDIDFDPLEFGLPPNILEVTDVSQLLALVVARQAFADAGYSAGREFNRERTGVILGVGGGQKLYTPLTTRLQYPVWERALKSSGLSDEQTREVIEKIKLAYIRWEENSFPGMLGNVIAGRIANRFDLGGINCVVDAACAASLAALKMAISELNERRCDMMLTGGVDTDNSIFMYMCFSKTPAFSRGERPRPFDSQSDGMMVGEGLGMLVLKRLDDAERDGDRIYAVIRGIGASSDGRFRSIYAPRSEGQALALRRAYADAAVPLESVGLIEAHGTGTIAGDLCEFTTLRQVFGGAPVARRRIALGSVKSQIGHTKSTAGAASLVKATLALYHKILPPTINVSAPNPKFGVDESPFYLNTETRPWINAVDAPPRRAGVSAFGFGGTNYHVVLEEYNREPGAGYRLHTVAQEMLLAADTPAGLREQCAALAAELSGGQALAAFNNAVTASQTLTIPAGAARLGFVAATPAEAHALLQEALDQLARQPDAAGWRSPRGVHYRRNAQAPGAVVALFAGQGAQYVGMGRELAGAFPELREIFGAVDPLFTRAGQPALSQVVFPPPAFDQAERQAQAAALQQTAYAQPAIGALSAGMYRLLEQAGLRADFAAGHSFGELTALWAAGALSDADYYTLMHARGQAMRPPSDPQFDAGTMIAVTATIDTVRAAISGQPEVHIANLNAPDQVVLAGSRPAIAQAEALLKQRGLAVVALPVAAAFHTPLVGHAQQPFAAAVQRISFQAPRIPVFANATAQPYPATTAEIQAQLAGQLLQPVRFVEQIEQIYAAGGRVFVEFGPRSVLTGLVGRILGDRPHMAVALNPARQGDSNRQLREALVQLRVAGLQLRGVDRYRHSPPAAPPAARRPALTVRLNGSNYVSVKTRAAYTQAVAASPQQTIDPPAAAPAACAAVDTTPVPAPAAAAPAPALGITRDFRGETVSVLTRSLPAHVPAAPQGDGKTNGAAARQPVPPGTSLSELHAHQRETLDLQRRLLADQAEFARATLHLLQQQFAPGAQPDPAALALLERSLAAAHQHQAALLQLHERYLAEQGRYAERVLAMLAGQSQFAPAHQPVAAAPPAPAAAPESSVAPAPPVPVVPAAPALAVAPAAPDPAATFVAPEPVAPEPVAPEPVAPEPAAMLATPAPAAAPAPALVAALLDVVAAKTGYPVETLELEMDLEADLGIDSIKRVEILGALQEQFPELPRLKPDELGELRTLQHVVARMGSVAAVSTAPVAAAAPAPAPAPAAPVAPEPVVTPAVAPALVNALLDVVAAKTGYPVETLELAMDLEADLGIDSIKRVEILGALQEQFPELPRLKPDELGELRTLQHVVARMGSVAAVPAAPVAAADPAPAPAAPVAPEPVVTPAVAPALVNALLDVVAAKTGYPVETLELAMDLEADLGIDSIKRVEILGALQEQFPELPRLKPDELGELRTLQHVVARMEATAAVATPPAAAAAPAHEATQQPAAPAVPRGVARLRTLPPPDRLDYRLPAGWICLVTDDGTALTPRLVTALGNLGWQPVVLRFPQNIVANRSLLPASVGRVVLPDMSEQQIEMALSTAAEYGPIGGLIHLHPPAGGHDTGLFPASEQQIVRHIFLMAKQLKHSLNEAARLAHGCFATVTRIDGGFGLEHAGNGTAVAGGLFGLVRTLNQEWPQVFCRAVDLDPRLEAEAAVQATLAELLDPNRLVVEVGYNGRGRVTLEAEFTAGDQH